jgi:hypothetical protein
VTATPFFAGIPAPRELLARLVWEGAPEARLTREVAAALQWMKLP